MVLSRINNLLMYILIWFIIFASAINYTYLPSGFSYFKDIIVFYFAIILILNRKIKTVKDIGVSFYILFLLVAVISWLGLIYGTSNSKIEIIIRIFRYLEFFLLFFIFTNFEKLCTIQYKNIINWYITLSLILIFVHIFGYFVPNNIVSIYIGMGKDNWFYRNRISVGQPPIAVYPMIISYLYLLVFMKNDKFTIIKMILLLIGIIISISTTGILSIVVTTIIFIIMSVDKKKIKKISYIIFILIILFYIGIKIIKSIPSLNKIYENQYNLLSIRIEALYNDNLTDMSMKERDIKYEEVAGNINNVFQKMFGLGLLGYNGNGKNVNSLSLENFYRTMQMCYGIIGLIVYILFLSKNILNGIKNIKTNEGMFILLLFIVFAMHSYTLEVLYVPTLSFTLPLFYCYVKKLEEDKYDNINC